MTRVLTPVNTDRLETASEVKLALHHVKEDGNRGFTQLDLRNQRHLQNRTHHLRDKLDLVWTCRMFRRNKLACLNPLDCLFKIFSVSFLDLLSVCDIFAGSCTSTGNIVSPLPPRSAYLCLTTTFMYFCEVCTTSILEAAFLNLSTFICALLIFRVSCNHNTE